ncbi:MAG: hypothetical protein AABZ39_18275 [Spirochaetota bacterium]
MENDKYDYYGEPEDEDSVHEGLRVSLRELEELQANVERSIIHNEVREEAFMPCLIETVLHAAFRYFPELAERREETARSLDAACRECDVWFGMIESVFRYYLNDPDRPPAGVIDHHLPSDDEIIAEVNGIFDEINATNERRAELIDDFVNQRKNDRHYAAFRFVLHRAVKTAVNRLFPEVQDLDANGLRELDHTLWVFALELSDEVYAAVGKYCIDPYDVSAD